MYTDEGRKWKCRQRLEKGDRGREAGQRRVENERVREKDTVFSFLFCTLAN